jgi:hypothetical protein
LKTGKAVRSLGGERPATVRFHGHGCDFGSTRRDTHSTRFAPG